MPTVDESITYVWGDSRDVKINSWPLVRRDDDGFRPVGRPRECFYCGQRHGQPHGEECPCVNLLVRWQVYYNHELVGILDDFEVAGYEQHTWEFGKNEGSWCSDNCLDDVMWVNGYIPLAIREIMESEDENGPCTCPLLFFAFERVLCEGPFITLRRR